MNEQLGGYNEQVDQSWYDSYSNGVKGVVKGIVNGLGVGTVGSADGGTIAVIPLY